MSFASAYKNPVQCAKSLGFSIQTAHQRTVPVPLQKIEISGNFKLLGQYCIKILGNFIFFGQVRVNSLGSLIFIKPSQFQWRPFF